MTRITFFLAPVLAGAMAANAPDDNSSCVDGVACSAAATPSSREEPSLRGSLATDVDTSKLKAKSIDHASMRLGPGLEGAVPEKGWTGKYDRIRIWFYDVDGDGLLSTEGDDGVSFDDAQFIAPLKPFFYGDEGLVEIAFVPDDGAFVAKFTTTPYSHVEGENGAIEGMIVLTELRWMFGLPVVPIDDRTSILLRDHLRYLELNPDHAAQDFNEQNPGNEGYSREAAGVARYARILRRPLINHLPFDADDPWTLLDYIDPAVDRVSLAASETYLGIEFQRQESMLGDFVVGYYPPDGMVDVPPSIGVGSPQLLANRAADERIGQIACVRLGSYQHNVEVTAASIRSVKGEGDKEKLGDPVEVRTFSPFRPARPSHHSRNASCAMVVPLEPLRPRTRYRVTIELGGETWTSDGYVATESVHTWDFTTGSD